MAICERNKSEVERLQKAGVDINESCTPHDPPVFLALMQQDPGILQEMLDAGARVNVNTQQRQTPLQLVQQIIDGLPMSQKLQAGDPVTMQNMLGSLVARTCCQS